MRTLFISYTGTLVARVRKEALANGLFYFGCTREHIFGQAQNCMDEVKWTFRDNTREGEQALNEIKEALLKAEAEGRVAWRKLGEPNSYSQLNNLLQANGFPRILEHTDDEDNYNYPTVKERVGKQQIGLIVVA